ncbi:MAG: helix-turn-helix transcriptional regulator [Succinivibrio sp.]
MSNKTDKITTPADQILNEHYLLKTVEVLKVLNISRSTLDRLKESAGFPKAITKIGNRPMWRKEDIIKWISN